MEASVPLIDEMKEINEIRRLAGLPQLEEGRKVAKPIIAYHGTSSTFLPDILKHGLQPFPKNLVWDKGYHKSYGGVYLTKSESMARSISVDTTEIDRIGGEPIVIKVQITLPSAKMDEDEMLGQLQHALRMVMKHIDPNKISISERHRDLYAKSVVNFLRGELGPVIPSHVENAIKEFSKMIFAKLNIKAEEHLCFIMREWYNKHPGYQKKYRKLVDIMTDSPVRKRGEKPGDGYKNATFRVTRPIGFRGRNRILGIVQYDWDDENKDVIKVIYPPIGKKQ